MRTEAIEEYKEGLKQSQRKIAREKQWLIDDCKFKTLVVYEDRGCYEEGTNDGRIDSGLGFYDLRRSKKFSSRPSSASFGVKAHRC